MKRAYYQFRNVRVCIQILRSSVFLGIVRFLMIFQSIDNYFGANISWKRFIKINHVFITLVFTNVSPAQSPGNMSVTRT